ncbi:2-C-methyl-D-erythritol 4-phosphate cytidylyltransferase [Hymenobacter sp. BRD67]|uniref:2-C-methyl-D-erythritol 4-phosphate cytidylyltransferase n=1 Tax=Hymenobacter sp. BRD67 TaxID=2675877 RepID=UPI001567BB3A|nr:2-C-methyl-D-erythritol 4-phosphate cytidylyltransferase [Hymenobacter sp. BRD67]QKG54173.1 2-C-methyl-D-erythritol 4-phosphate cytidylyltransferase [Hymenobacter sp. BRD67]
MTNPSNPVRYAILVAGGTGQRMGADRPKQFLLLRGEPVLLHTLRRFAESALGVAQVVVVLPFDQLAYWQSICEKYDITLPHTLVAGGATRWASVKAGLAALPADAAGALVAVHDGVRPLVSTPVIEAAYQAAATHGAAAAAVPPKDSVRLLGAAGSSPLDRRRLRLMQTPQTFDLALLRRAYRLPELPTFTDDASVVDDLHPVQLVEGDYRNLKITTPEDLLLAEALLAAAV